jgi:hypothetical protein
MPLSAAGALPYRHSGLACHGVAIAKTGSGIHAFLLKMDTPDKPVYDKKKWLLQLTITE